MNAIIFKYRYSVIISDDVTLLWIDHSKSIGIPFSFSQLHKLQKVNEEPKQLE